MTEAQKRTIDDIAARRRAARFCGRGHEFTEENTGWRSNGRRACYECQRIRQRDQYWRKQNERAILFAQTFGVVS